MKKYKLELIVFTSGAVVMMLEMIGSRVFAPFLGTSIFVWTSLIGIILGSLSLGYFLGGKIADKKASFENFSLVLLMTAILIGFSVLAKPTTLNFIQANISSVRTGAVIATLLLFAPPSVFLGMVSPYAVKLKMKSLEKTGRTVGNLYALSTIGSIVGTFLAGFYLISYIGNTSLLLLLAILMALLAFIAHPKKLLSLKIASSILLVLYLLSTATAEASLEKDGVIEIETQYNHVTIFEDVDANTNRPLLRMSLNKNNSSAMYVYSDDLYFEYTKFYDIAAHFYPNFEKALMIGGAAYTYPKYFLKKYPGAAIDVVEIDPGLTELAKKYFQLKDNPRLRVFHEDGRTFLNKTTEKYDVIFGDAFKAFYSIPHQLTTIEAVQKMYDALTEKGIAVINIICSIEGDKSEFLRAEYHTFKEVFPQVYVFGVNHPENGQILQNLTLVALKSEEIPSFESENKTLNMDLKHLWEKEIPLDMPVLTDDFAPVDKYIIKLL